MTVAAIHDWILFDIGNVLWLDEPMLCEHWVAIHEVAHDTGVDISFDRLMAMREDLVRERDDPVPHVTASQLLLGTTGWQAVRKLVEHRTKDDWDRYNILIHGTNDLLSELSRRYALAAAANQPATARAHLDRLGLLRHFHQVGISGEMGVEKPDPAFFTALLRQLQCAPANAIMVGDRIDNDIAPAQRLGMRTIWVVLDVEQHGYRPDDPLRRAYLRSLRRTPSRGRGPVVVQPSATARSLNELRDTIYKMLPST